MIPSTDFCYVVCLSWTWSRVRGTSEILYFCPYFKHICPWKLLHFSFLMTRLGNHGHHQSISYWGWGYTSPACISASPALTGPFQSPCPQFVSHYLCLLRLWKIALFTWILHRDCCGLYFSVQIDSQVQRKSSLNKEMKKGQRMDMRAKVILRSVLGKEQANRRIYY